MSADILEVYTWRPTILRTSTGAAISGMDIHVWDGSVTPVKKVNGLTTDANGQIAEQTLERRLIEITVTTTRTITDRTPHLFRAVRYEEEIVDLQQNIQQATTPTFYTDTDNLTTVTKAAALAYTGYAVNHTTDTVDLTGATVWTANKLYDRNKAVAEDAVQYEPVQIMATIDGTNYSLNYNLTIDGHTFDGGNSSFNMDTGKTVTISGTGNITDQTIIGDLYIDAATDLTNVTVDGDVYVDTGANSTLSWTNVTITTGNVWNDDTIHTLTINKSGGTFTAGDPGTGVGQTNIVQSVSVTFEAVDKDDNPISGVQISGYLVSDDSEVILDDTSVAGIATTTFGKSTPANMYYRYRKASPGDTKYENLSGFATIETGTGVSVKRSMTVDDNNNS